MKSSGRLSKPLPKGPGVVQGDIMITASEYFKSKFRNRIPNKHKQRWPDGIVPYKVTDWKNKLLKKNIEAALNKLSKDTGGCVSFREATSRDRDYVNVVADQGCWSSVGRQGGEQKLSLSIGCELHGTIQHEFIHALGFSHEQNRPDRDKNINVHWENVDTDECDQFVKYGVVPREPYDIKSIMHYGVDEFSCNLRWTMSTKDGKKVGGSSLTKLDIAKIKSLYDCK